MCGWGQLTCACGGDINRYVSHVAIGDGQCNAGHQWRPRLLIALSPIYVWLAAITALPHKEERFMYVVYPLVRLGLSPLHSWWRSAITVAQEWQICLSVLLSAEYLGMCCITIIA